MTNFEHIPSLPMFDVSCIHGEGFLLQTEWSNIQISEINLSNGEIGLTQQWDGYFTISFFECRPNGVSKTEELGVITFGFTNFNAKTLKCILFTFVIIKKLLTY